MDQEGAGDRVIKYLADVQKALDKQYTNLFDNAKFDLSVDMDAMTIALKRDDLIDPDYQPDPVPEESQFDEEREEEFAETESVAEAPIEAQTVEEPQEETVMPKPPFMTNEERTLELQEPPIPQPSVFSEEMREIRQQEPVPAEISAAKDAAKDAVDDVVDDVSDLFKPEA